MDELHRRDEISEDDYVNINNMIDPAVGKGLEVEEDKKYQDFANLTQEWKDGNHINHKKLCTLLKEFTNRGITEPAANKYFKQFIDVLCAKLEMLGRKYDSGNTSVVSKLLHTGKALVDMKALTPKDYEQYICKPLRENEHL